MLGSYLLLFLALSHGVSAFSGHGTEEPGTEVLTRRSFQETPPGYERSTSRTWCEGKKREFGETHISTHREDPLLVCAKACEINPECVAFEFGANLQAGRGEQLDPNYCALSSSCNDPYKKVYGGYRGEVVYVKKYRDKVLESSGKCASKLTENECKKFATATGRQYGRSYCGSPGSTCAPQGCYVWSGNNKFYWNNDRAGSCSSSKKCACGQNDIVEAAIEMEPLATRGQIAMQSDEPDLVRKLLNLPPGVEACAEGVVEQLYKTVFGSKFDGYELSPYAAKLRKCVSDYPMTIYFYKGGEAAATVVQGSITQIYGFDTRGGSAEAQGICIGAGMGGPGVDLTWGGGIIFGATADSIRGWSMDIAIEMPSVGGISLGLTSANQVILGFSDGTSILTSNVASLSLCFASPDIVSDVKAAGQEFLELKNDPGEYIMPDAPKEEQTFVNMLIEYGLFGFI